MNVYGKGAAGRPRRGRMIAAAGLALAFVADGAFEAYAQNCKPRRPRPPVTLTSMGPCKFDPATLSFAGEPAEQAMCLMRAADKSRNIGPPLESIPPGIAGRVGQTSGLPERDALAAHLVELGLVWDFAPFLWTPLGRAHDNDIDAPQARYFVIHDTSSPFIGGRPFPADLDDNRSINDLARYACQDDWALAHVFINRGGAMLLSRELSEPWRATKFERASRFGSDLKGLFLHIELIQPRGSMPGRRNDARAPDPGFSAAQYDRLALVYVIASVRSDRWLIPAFHAAIDSGIRGGHDDPQNFELESFSSSIDRLVARLTQAQPVVASITYEGATAETPVRYGSATEARAAIDRNTQALAPVSPAVATTEAPAPVTAGVATTETRPVEETSTRSANPAPKRMARWQRAAKKTYRSYRYARPKAKSRTARMARRR